MDNRFAEMQDREDSQDHDLGYQITNRSTNSFTGMSSSFF